MVVKGVSSHVPQDDAAPAASTTRTQAQRRERTRNALIDAGRALFAERG
jgi:AcrR family transcriptional regulator